MSGRLALRGDALRLRVRSMVGLIPLFASAVIDSEALDRLPVFRQHVMQFATDYITAVRWQLQLARTGLDAGQPAADPVSEKDVLLLR